MAPPQSTAQTERERKLKTLLVFASSISQRLANANDESLANDLQTHIRGLPLQPSTAGIAKQNELNEVGTDLWNRSTRLLRDEVIVEADGKAKEEMTRRNRALCLLRAFSFLLLDSAGGHTAKRHKRSSCIRLMKIALKAAKVCIDDMEFASATKVLERAADYQDILSKEGESGEMTAQANLMRVEYFAVRTTLAWRQERLDTAEHLFAKCKQITRVLTPNATEKLTDLFFEIGRDALMKHNYETAIRWLERAQDVLGEQDLELLSPENSELRLSVMQSIAQAYMKQKTPEAQDKASQMVKLMETDFGDKMVVPLLKLELLSHAETIDTVEFYGVLLRMIRTVVLNNTNFRTIIHHIHKLKDHNNVTACKALDDLIGIRLLREENQTWLEKAIIIRVWICTSNTYLENVLEQLQQLFDIVMQSSKTSLDAPATHAAQTLLWKRVEIASGQEQYTTAEAWCQICLHPIFEKAGVQNKAKVARRIIQCALSRHDYTTAREAHSKMSDSGKDEPVTRYLMYKVGLQSADTDFAAECLKFVCRRSSKDTTLLHACVMEAQKAGDKRQAILALERVLDMYDSGTSTGINLPALLRCIARLLQSELLRNGSLDLGVMSQLCAVFEGACSHAKKLQTRSSTLDRQIFTTPELEWFSKNAYNLSLKFCTEMRPENLVRLLNICIEFIKILKERGQLSTQGDFCLRLVFCAFLAACTYTILARAEDDIEKCLQYYREARKHSKEFRLAAAEGIERLSGSAQADIISKHFQIVKLELEAVLKLSKWEELDDLFDQCWKYKSSDHYETLADLVLVIHSCVVKAGLDSKYQKKILSVLQKIISLTCQQPGSEMTRLSHWIRCLFNLSLELDDEVCFQCIEQVTHIAAKKQGVCPSPIVGPACEKARSRLLTHGYILMLNTCPPSASGRARST